MDSGAVDVDSMVVSVGATEGVDDGAGVVAATAAVELVAMAENVSASGTRGSLLEPEHATTPRQQAMLSAATSRTVLHRRAIPRL